MPREAERVHSFQELAAYVDKHKDKIRVRHENREAFLTDLPTPIALSYALGIVRSGAVPLVEE